MVYLGQFPTNRNLLAFLSKPLVFVCILFSLRCGNVVIKQGDKAISEDQNHFLLYQGKPFTGIYKQENDILQETYETEFYKGVPHGSYTVKSYSGTVLEIRTIRYGQKHGKQTLFFSSGNKRQVSEFENGIPIGEHIEYYDNGQIASYQTFFPSGKPRVVKKWNKRGQIFLNHVFLESGESFGRPGSKLCEPTPDENGKQRLK